MQRKTNEKIDFNLCEVMRVCALTYAFMKNETKDVQLKRERESILLKSVCFENND